MNTDREILLDFVQRMRDAERIAQQKEQQGLFVQQEIWLTRARAFDEVYTELKGAGFGQR